MRQALSKVSKILLSSFDQTALMAGTSDILAIKWNNGQCFSTPFLACFGAHMIESQIKVYINEMLINGVNFHLDQYGYVQPMMPDQEVLSKLHLRYGKNRIRFELESEHCLSAQIYLYSQEDKFLVSDFDGTMTKSDIRGLYHNIKNVNYLHEGYYELIDNIEKNGYRIIWLTMRSLPLYKFSKNYIRQHTRIDGILLTEPEEFFPAVKKEILKKTGNIKTNMMMLVRRLFPQNCNPFIGGLGNRENDAIAYLAAGIPKEQIFMVNKKSEVHNLAHSETVMSYWSISQRINQYFPEIKIKIHNDYSHDNSEVEEKSNKNKIKIKRRIFIKRYESIQKSCLQVKKKVFSFSLDQKS